MKILKNSIIEHQNELILSLIWIISILIVNPIGDFPLNDDWAYGLDVFHLSQEGKLILNDWPGMTLIAQVLWGSLVTFLFGFSFTALRLSTLVVGLLSVWIFYHILTYTGLSKKKSFWGALLFMFTPLFFNGSFTFMTEVYFLFTFNLSIFYFLKFIKSEQMKYLVLGTLFVLVTTLIRQPGILIGIAFTVVFLLIKKGGTRQLIIALTPAIVALVGYLGYSLWLKYNFNMPNYKGMGTLVSHIWKTPVDFYFNRVGIIAMYLGFFSLPITVLLLPKLIMNYRWNEKIIIIILFTIPLFIGSFFKEFPSGNIIYNLGLGPKLLKDGAWGYNIHPMIPVWGMNMIRIVSLLSAAIVVTHFFKQSFKNAKCILKKHFTPARFARALFVTLFFFYLGFILLNTIFFDRYTLPLIPSFFLILLPVKFIHIRSRFLFGTLIAVYAVFCITATRDYMSWNRARWKAIDHLTNEMNIEKTKIDGGFEFNSWFQTGPFNPIDKDKISWWFVASDDYALSFGNIKGFKKIGKTVYNRMLIPGVDSVCILQKNENELDILSSIRCNCEVRVENSAYFLSENSSAYFICGNQQSREEALSGSYSIKLDKENPYGLLSKYPKVKAGDRYTISVWRKSTEDKAGIVVSVEPGNNLYYFNHKSIKNNSFGWNKIVSEIVIPDNCDGLEIRIYVWSPGEEIAWFDDLEITKKRLKTIRTP